MHLQPSQPHHLPYTTFVYIASQVSHKTIKIYLADVQLEHLERGLRDPMKDELLHLLSNGTKVTKHTDTHLPPHYYQCPPNVKVTTAP